MQRDWRPGKDVTAPVAKAQISVTDVTVMEAPACFIVIPMFVTTVFVFFFSAGILFKHLIMTNISSMPIPRQIKGRTAVALVKGKPKAIVRATPIVTPKNTAIIPAAARQNLPSTMFSLPRLNNVYRNMSM